MLQRLGFAYPMQPGVPLCVTDEPFAGVDPETRAALTDLLFDAPVDRLTIICTRHLEEMAERGATIARIANGTVAMSVSAAGR